ncbi:hypothetical protein GGF42_009400, partial [Coemansia sp. RSA 2424]
MPLHTSFALHRRQVIYLLLCALASVVLAGIIVVYSIGINGSSSESLGAGNRHRQRPNPYVLSGLASLSSDIARDDNADSIRAGFDAYLQSVHRSIHTEDLQAYCAQSNFGDAFVASAEQRYKNITSGATEPIFVAANLYNSEKVLPNMAAQLLALADTVGHSRLFISIYENGSKDKTKEILHRFNATLDALGIAHRIIADDTPKPEHIHRIEYLAKLRNYALEPLYDNGAKFGRVMFVNDMYFCLTDLLELVF